MHKRLQEMGFDDSIEGVDPLSLEVFRAFRRAMYAHKMLIFRKLGEKDTHPGQAMCLWAISRSDGMSQRDLAETLGISRPTVTVMLQKMEKAGLIQREVDAEDQRFTRIYVTEAGRALNEGLQSVHAGVINTTIGALPEKDRRELGRILGEMVERANESSKSVNGAE